MKRKLSKLSLALAASVLLLGAQPAFSQDLKYLSCGSGGAVKDPFGNCVRSLGGSDLPACIGASPVVAEPSPVPAPLVLSLAADANFDFDKSELKPAGRASLDQLVQDMQQVQVNSIDIVGHTDSVGTESYNQGLSERRARSAASYLAGKGVSPNIISTSGRGELQPIATNATAEGRAQNRRVDITVDAVRPQ